jgi:hypothetical protein
MAAVNLVLRDWSVTPTAGEINLPENVVKRLIGRAGTGAGLHMLHSRAGMNRAPQQDSTPPGTGIKSPAGTLRVLIAGTSGKFLVTL